MPAHTAESHVIFFPQQTFTVPLFWNSKIIAAFRVAQGNRFHQIWAGVSGVHHQAKFRVVLGKGVTPIYNRFSLNDSFQLGGEMDLVELPIHILDPVGGDHALDSLTTSVIAGQSIFNTGPFYEWVTTSDSNPKLGRTFIIEQPTDWIAILGDLSAPTGNFIMSAFLAGISSSHPPYMNHELSFFGRC